MNFYKPSKKILDYRLFKRIITLCAVLFFFTTLITCSNYIKKEKKTFVTNGVMDLSNWDFSTNGPVKLSGNWEFYKNQLLNPVKDTNDLKNQHDYKHVPAALTSSLWNKDLSPDLNYGTYRLTLKHRNNIPENMALKILKIYSSYNVYIDGKKIFSSGQVGTNKQSSIPACKTGLIYFSTKKQNKNTMEILIQVSNFHHKDSGIIQNVILGTSNQITNLREKNITIEFFFFGSMIIMGLYHLGIFSLNKDDKSLLYFGLLCFILASWTILSNEKVCINFIPDTSWEISIKLEYLSIYLSIPIAALFMQSMFKNEFNKKILFTIVAVAVLFISSAIVSPILLISYTFVLFKIFIIIFFTYTAYVLLRAFIKKRGGGNILLYAFCFLLMTFLIDITLNYSNTDVNHSILLGLFIIIISNAYIVALKFSNAVSLIEDLTETLAESTIEVEKKNITLLDMNWNLEQKVKDRTEELQRALNKLELSNKNLTRVFNDLEAVHEESKKDMGMAIRVQRNFLPLAVPESNEWDIAYHFNPMAGVSGDFYDFFSQKDILTGVGIFDVSGHGIASGLISTLAKSIIHRNFIINTDKQLNEILTISNRELQNELKEIFHYVTGALLRFNENKVEYVSAGHPEIILKNNGVAKKVLNKKNKHISGSILGIENINNPYEKLEFSIAPGDFILLYTDGFLDSPNKHKECFEIERTLKFFSDAPSDSAQSALDYLLDKFYDFIDNDVSTDDITLIMLKRI